MAVSGRVGFWKGQLLELRTLEGEVYVTQIVRTDSEYLYIQRPINRKNEHLHVSHGMPVTVSFQDDLQGVSHFDANLNLVNNISISIKIPSNEAIKKAQRRRFFRVPVEVDLFLNHQLADNTEHKQSTKVTTKDISGGGLSFICPYKMERDIVVKGNIDLKTNTYQRTVAFNGKVVNCEQIQDRRYKVSLEFIEMKESVRSDIIRYCMFKQIEMRNKLRNYPI